jgi:hypothetical protein
MLIPCLIFMVTTFHLNYGADIEMLSQEHNMVDAVELNTYLDAVTNQGSFSACPAIGVRCGMLAILDDDPVSISFSYYPYWTSVAVFDKRTSFLITSSMGSSEMGWREHSLRQEYENSGLGDRIDFDKWQKLKTIADTVDRYLDFLETGYHRGYLAYTPVSEALDNMSGYWNVALLPVDGEATKLLYTFDGELEVTLKYHDITIWSATRWIKAFPNIPFSEYPMEQGEMDVFYHPEEESEPQCAGSRHPERE